MPRIESIRSKGRWGAVIAILIASMGFVGCGEVETPSDDPAQVGQAADTLGPSTPTGLAAAAASPSRINLSWSASTDNVAVAGYRVYRGGVLLTSLGSTTTYQDTSVRASTTYSFTVQAFDGAGNASGQSTAVILTTPATVDVTAPSTPSSLSANAVSASRIDLNWPASTDNIAVTGYRVFRDGTLLAIQGNVTAYQDAGLGLGTTYVYTVRAVDAAGNVSGPSPAASATTLAGLDTTAPSTPSGLSANAVSPSQINVSWSASTDNVAVAGYRVYRNGVFIAILVSVTAYQDTGLTPNTTYSYNVDAIDASANVSILSAAASATTLTAPDTIAPSTPIGLTANAASSSRINLSWSPSTDNVAVTGYGVFRNGAPLITLGNVTTYQDIGLAAVTTYSYRVRALDAAGNASGQSIAASATTPAVPDTIAPSTPTGLNANAASSSRINLSWSASTDNMAVTGYRVYRNGVFLIALGNVTAYESTGLSASTTYSYNVDAIDAAGNASGISTVAAATTLAPNTATLAWDAVIHPNLSGYRIYYGNAPGNYSQAVGQGINVGNVTIYTVAGLTSGTRYYFTATAFDTSNNESVFSNEVFKDIP